MGVGQVLGSNTAPCALLGSGGAADGWWMSNPAPRAHFLESRGVWLGHDGPGWGTDVPGWALGGPILPSHSG